MPVLIAYYVNMKILIIDDDPDIRLVIRLTLSDYESITIFEAETKNEALECVRKESPDVILLDYHLESITGDEVLKKILLLPQGEKSKTIFLTAKTSHDLLESLHKLPIVGIINKPFDINTFADELFAMVGHPHV